MSSVLRGLVVAFLFVLPVVVAAVVINNRDVYINGGNLFIDNNAVLLNITATPPLFSSKTSNTVSIWLNVGSGLAIRDNNLELNATTTASCPDNNALSSYDPVTGAFTCVSLSAGSTSIACSDCAPYFVDVSGDQMTGSLEINLLSQTGNDTATDWNELVDALIIWPNGDHAGLYTYSTKFVLWSAELNSWAHLEANYLYARAYYDLDSASYYVDPSGSTVLSSLTANSITVNAPGRAISIIGTSRTDVPRLYISMPLGGGLAPGIELYNVDTGTDTIGWIARDGKIVNFEYPLGTGKAYVGTDGNIYSSNYVIGATGLCIGTDCRTAWPSGISDVNGEPPVVVTGTDVKTVSISIGPSLKVENNALEINVNRSVGCTGTNAIQEINLITGDVVCIDTATGTTGAITGSGDVNYLAYFTNTDNITSALTLYYNPSTGYLGIGTTTPTYLLDVNGPLNVRASIRVDLPATDNPSTEANDIVDVFYARTTSDHIGITGNVDKFVFWNKDAERFAGIEVNFVRAHGPVYSENNLVLTVVTPFSGDVTGTYDNLQLGENVVGAYELNLSELNAIYDARYVNEGQPAGGDVTGTFSSLIVTGIWSFPVPDVGSITTPGALYWTGKEWNVQVVDTDPSDDLTISTTFSGDVSGTYDSLQLNAGVVGTTELADNSVTSAKIADGTIQVADLNTDDFNAMYDNRYVNEGQVAGGDLSGTYPNPAVAKIQGYPVSTTAPSAGQALVWDGAAWSPKMLIKRYVITDGSSLDGATITPPGDCLMYAYLVGGGAGGSYNSGDPSITGGGSGAMIYLAVQVTAGDTVSVSVGSGGTGGTSNTSPGNGEATVLYVNGAQVASAGGGVGASGGLPSLASTSNSAVVALMNYVQGASASSEAGAGLFGSGYYYGHGGDAGATTGSNGSTGNPGIAILTFVCN